VTTGDVALVVVAFVSGWIFWDRAKAMWKARRAEAKRRAELDAIMEDAVRDVRALIVRASEGQELCDQANLQFEQALDTWVNATMRELGADPTRFRDHKWD
jgi:type II secretory pathway component PulM